jgi:hypothetical protein
MYKLSGTKKNQIYNELDNQYGYGVEQREHCAARDPQEKPSPVRPHTHPNPLKE